MTAPTHRSDTPLVVLAVQADESAPAPVREALWTVYELHWVTSAAAALAALEEHPHDAFLLDAAIGEDAGLDVAREILAVHPHAPVILLDTAADRETDLAATAAGVAD